MTGASFASASVTFPMVFFGCSPPHDEHALDTERERQHAEARRHHLASAALRWVPVCPRGRRSGAQRTVVKAQYADDEERVLGADPARAGDCGEREARRRH